MPDVQLGEDGIVRLGCSLRNPLPYAGQRDISPERMQDSDLCAATRSHLIAGRTRMGSMREFFCRPGGVKILTSPLGGVDEDQDHDRRCTETDRRYLQRT